MFTGVLGITATNLRYRNAKIGDWGRLFRPSCHVARLILISLYSDTRYEAILKHTCITWMIEGRVPIWEVTGFSGAS